MANQPNTTTRQPVIQYVYEDELEDGVKKVVIPRPVESRPAMVSEPEVQQEPQPEAPATEIGGRSYKTVDWDAVIQRIETVDDYTLLHDQMSIPPELKKLEDAGFYCYRWLDEKSDRFHEQLDGHIPWEIVNRGNSPEVPDRYFDISGAIRKGANGILARMHRKAHDLRQNLIWKASETPTRMGEFREGMEFEPNQKIRSGDIVVAAETEDGRFQKVNQRASADSDE